jgi:hypothetical protein
MPSPLETIRDLRARLRRAEREGDELAVLLVQARAEADECVRRGQAASHSDDLGDRINDALNSQGRPLGKSG